MAKKETFMNVTSLAGSALVSAYERFGNAATNLVKAASPIDSAESVDLPDAIVELNEAKVETAASAKVLKVAREVEQNLLDIFA